MQGVKAETKFNAIFVFRTINSIKLQEVHFYISDFNFSGNQGVKQPTNNDVKQKTMRFRNNEG